MTTERVQTSDVRLHLPVNPIGDAPDVYAAYGVANYYGELIGMLRFRFQDDSWRALPYYCLSSMAYDPTLGIELSFTTALIRLRGRNLFPLFTFIGDHGVRWVWEADRAASLQSLERDTVIERIELGAAKSRS
jgi:hypothetical protein